MQVVPEQLPRDKNPSRPSKLINPTNLQEIMQSAVSFLSEYNSSSIETSFQISSLALSKTRGILYLASQDGMIAIIDRKVYNNIDQNGDRNLYQNLSRNTDKNLYQILEKRFANMKVTKILLSNDETKLLLLI